MTEIASLPLNEKIRRLQGPILVLGSSGFLGANLLQTLLKVRKDSFGTTTRKPAWRLAELPDEHVKVIDLLVDSNLDALLAEVRPQTIFNCVAYGAYSLKPNPTHLPDQLQLRPGFTTAGIGRLPVRPFGHFFEYGDNAASPNEQRAGAQQRLCGSKVAAANLLHYGKRASFCANLRLYSISPLEDASPDPCTSEQVATEISDFVNPSISRDFVYVDDAVEAFVDTALNLSPDFTASLQYWLRQKDDYRRGGRVHRELFGIAREPRFPCPNALGRQDWFADPSKARERLAGKPIPASRTACGERQNGTRRSRTRRPTRRPAEVRPDTVIA